MNKRSLLLTLMISCQTVLAEDNQSNHNEARNGGIGLVAGSLVAGPIGGIIGGAIGVLTGDQQSKQQQISHQQITITELEQSISRLQSEYDKTIHQCQQQSKRRLDKINQFNQSNSDLITQNKKLAEAYQLDIYFTSNSSIITQQAQQGLTKLATLLTIHKNVRINLAAHSDWRGTDEFNFALAEQRLTTVSQFLQQAGVTQSKILATNYGEHYSQPRVNGENLFYSRRVTATIDYF